MRDSTVSSGWSAGLADRNRQRSPFSPPLDSVAGQHAADPFADRGQHFLAAAIQDDEELIVRSNAQRSRFSRARFPASVPRRAVKRKLLPAPGWRGNAAILPGASTARRRAPGPPTNVVSVSRKWDRIRAWLATPVTSSVQPGRRGAVAPIARNSRSAAVPQMFRPRR